MTVSAIEYVLRSLDTSWNYARWELLPADGNRYEVLDGVLYMATAPSFFHQWIVQRLVRLIGIPAEDQRIAFAAIAPIGVLIPGCDPVQPDFLLVRYERQHIIADRRVRGVPDLIVEVISPSNAEQDTDLKRGIYARAGVPEYWMVRPQSRDLLCCWNPAPDLADYTEVRLITTQMICSAMTLPAIKFAVADLFAGAPDTTI